MRVLAITLLLLVAVLARAEQFSVIVDDIPKPVTIEFPKGFVLANDSPARERRERLLNFFRLNKALKGKQSEILLTDWRRKQRLPCIIVGVLATTTKHQGKLTENNWNSIRAEFIRLNQEGIKAIRDKFRPPIEANSPISMKITEELVWLEQQQDPQSAVIMAHFRQEIDGELETVFSARKLIFHKGYLISVNVVVDSSKPEALKNLKDHLKAIRVVSI